MRKRFWTMGYLVVKSMAVGIFEACLATSIHIISNQQRSLNRDETGFAAGYLQRGTRVIKLMG